jgi:tellurite resistance protein TerC
VSDPIWWLWFNLFLVAMLALDLGVFNRKAHVIRVKEALVWSGVWVVLALLFTLLVAAQRGSEPAMEFLTGWMIEKSLSIDNVFVFLILFNYLKIPPLHQHKVLFWGIVGALAMRAAFIFAGVALIERFHWMIYLFGAVLVVSGVKMIFEKKPAGGAEEPGGLVRFLGRLFPVAGDASDGRLFTRAGGKLKATPVLAALVVVNVADVIFAVDSIPAILAVTRDTFIVYTSNAFAILGLRALYFAVAGVLKIFHHLHYGLAAILIFVGIKMALDGVYRMPILASLGVIAAILAASIGASLIWPERAGALSPPTSRKGR